MRRISKGCGELGAQQIIDAGMWEEYTNSYGIQMVRKVEEKETDWVEHQATIGKEKTDDGLIGQQSGVWKSRKSRRVSGTILPEEWYR